MGADTGLVTVPHTWGQNMMGRPKTDSWTTGCTSAGGYRR